jgi:hypothetical protein
MRHKTMTLSPDEFMRRFLLHVLPGGFHRIRHYGLLANGGRSKMIHLPVQRHLPPDGRRADSCRHTLGHDQGHRRRPIYRRVGPHHPLCRTPFAHRTSSPSAVTQAAQRQSP